MLYLRAYLTSTGFHDRLRKYRDRIAKDYVTSVSYKKKAIFDPYMYLRPREIDELYIDIGSEVIDE
jgi:hypothetical protein